MNSVVRRVLDDKIKIYLSGHFLQRFPFLYFLQQLLLTQSKRKMNSFISNC
jgi:hypothetical protein